MKLKNEYYTLGFNNIITLNFVLRRFLHFWRVTVTVTKLWHRFSCPKERKDFAVFIIFSYSGPVKQIKTFKGEF